VARDNPEYQQMLRKREMNIKYYDGIHLHKSEPKSVGNKIYNVFGEVHESWVSYLTANKPKWIFRSQERMDVWDAKSLNQVVGDVVYDMCEWNDKGEDAIIEAETAGSVHIKTILKNSFVDETGSIRGYPDFVVIPGYAIIPDPQAKNKRNLRYIAHLIMKNVADIKRTYGIDLAPEYGIENAKMHPRDIYSVMKTYEGNTSYTMPSQIIDLKDNSIKRIADDVIGQCLIVEMWMEDGTMEEIPFTPGETVEEHGAFASLQDHPVLVTDHHIKHIESHQAFLNTLRGGEDDSIIKLVLYHIEKHQGFPKATKRRKYPYGRVVTYSQGQLLSDKPNPMAPIDWRDVWIKFDWFKRRDSYWGKSLGEDLIDPQDDVNHRKNSIVMNINLLNNGIRKVRIGTWDKLKGNLSKLNNIIGKWIPVVNHDDIDIDFGKELPSQYFNDLAWTVDFIYKRAHRTDLMAGQMPKGSPPNTLVENLLQASSKVVGNPLSHYATALKLMATNAVLLMQNYLPPDEVFEIVGADNQPEYMQWGKFKDKATLIKNIRVDTESMMPTSKMQKLQEAILMRQHGVYDNQAVLEEVDDPKAYDVLKRTSEINYLRTVSTQLQDQNDQLKKEINTMTNRLQKYEMQGNVGTFKTES